MEGTALDELADAISKVANARDRFRLDHFLNEIALNILILSRMASNRLDNADQRAAIDNACDNLAGLLREAAQDAFGRPDA
ncbi:hypothetical protein L0U85_06110 [Glycomyces sp. L485]|uniref:hypothetical protein n=1 Tax=Glycomyces sp. L485 TaxID=2909235 RepID=UPI001F4AD14C|nr:hypothetical protein [Glycomyces sp. L485]MCH7230430.1 hypothetical protein [Glycomyces sp. L485]